MGFTLDMDENQLTVSENGELLCWIREDISEKTATLFLGGKLRGDTAYVFLDEAKALVSVGMGIILDLSETKYLSNAHLKAMLDIQRSVDKGAQQLVLQNLSPEARAAFDAVGAGTLFDIR